MKIAVIGTGYVGLTSGVCLASKGHEVTCVDIDSEKVGLINSGKSPIYEKGLQELLKEVLIKKLFTATLDIKKAVEESEVVFICVGTPCSEDGSINLNYIKKATESISEHLKYYKVIVVKSTVVPGTTINIIKKILDEKCNDYGLCMNPEFLKEGTAVEDFLNGDRLVLGVDSTKTENIMRRVYAGFPQEVFVTNPTTAEMIKYANNSLLATKVSFANELGNLCKKLGIDAYDVMDGVGFDKRLCRSFLNAGAGFGGSCFPKDVKAIISKGVELEEPMTLLKSVIKVNDAQPLKMIELLKKHLNPAGKRVGLLGLSFKPGTDDVREAPRLKIIDELLKLESKVIVYDPEAMKNVKKLYGDKIDYADNATSLVAKVDAVLIVTDWSEFKKPELYTNKIVIDGRRIKTNASEYEGICW